MSEKNLPIKLVLQKATDVQPNKGGGKPKFFGDVTPALQKEIIGKFDDILAFYENVFHENDLIPAVGKITVKPEAIAKSHKPNDLCRCCKIIGSEDLNEIYIKVTEETILATINLIKNPPSQRFKANLTAVLDIQPIHPQEKISLGLSKISAQGLFDLVKGKIKVKFFDFDDEFDNVQILGYITKHLNALGFSEKHELIAYGDQIKYIKVQVESFEDVKRIAAINGVKIVDFFQEYSLPLSEFANSNLKTLLNTDLPESDISIGIIDSGISDDNPFLSPYVASREIYVAKDYQNPSHATFIASTIQYGNKLNGIAAPTTQRFQFVDVIAIPNGDPKFGPTDTIDEDALMEIIEEVMKKHSLHTKIWNLSLGIENKICTGSIDRKSVV